MEIEKINENRKIENNDHPNTRGLGKNINYPKREMEINRRIFDLKDNLMRHRLQ